MSAVYTSTRSTLLNMRNRTNYKCREILLRTIRSNDNAVPSINVGKPCSVARRIKDTLERCIRFSSFTSPIWNSSKIRPGRVHESFGKPTVAGCVAKSSSLGGLNISCGRLPLNYPYQPQNAMHRRRRTESCARRDPPWRTLLRI